MLSAKWYCRPRQAATATAPSFPSQKGAKFQNILADSRGQPQRKVSCHAQATATGHARPHRCALVPEQINGKDRTKSTRTQTTALTDVRAVVSRKDKARIASEKSVLPRTGDYYWPCQAAPLRSRSGNDKRNRSNKKPCAQRRRLSRTSALSCRAKIKQGSPQRKASCHAQATTTGHAKPHRCALVPGIINGTGQTKKSTRTQTTALKDVRAVVSRKDKARIASE